MITLHYLIADQKAKKKKHEFGCRIYERGEFLKYVKDFKITNKRICYLRLKAKWFSCALINLHAPTNKKTEDIKEEFYKLLEQNINQIANPDLEILMQKLVRKTYTNPLLAMKVYIMKPTTTQYLKILM